MEATGVGVETIRKDWEQGIRHRMPDRIEVALAAGDLKAQRDLDPEYCKTDGQAAPADVVALYHSLLAEPLAPFGARFKQRFKRRYNPP